MLKRVALVLLAIGSPVLLGSFIVGGKIAQLVFVLVSVLFPVAFFALGIGRGRLQARWIWGLLGLALFFEALVVSIILRSGEPRDPGWLLGLPPATLLMLCGLGLAPLIFIGLAYASTFEHSAANEDLSSAKRRGG